MSSMQQQIPMQSARPPAAEPATALLASIAGLADMGAALRPLTLLVLYCEPAMRDGLPLPDIAAAHDDATAILGPVACRDGALEACRVALACRAGGGVRRGAPGGASRKASLAVRIGIASADPAAGTMSGATTIAPRLARACDHYGCDIILTEQTRLIAGDRIRVRELDRVTIGGQAGLPIFELLGIAERAGTAPSWVALYEAGLAAYRRQRFAGAIGLFQMLQNIRPWDRPSRLMIERCRQLIAAPPAADWCGSTGL